MLGALTELGKKYALQELCQIAPPYTGSRFNLETIVRTVDTYLSRGSFEERLGGWLRAPVSPEDPLDPPGALSNVADILLGESQGEGIIPALLDRNRQVRCLLEYQDVKQTLGERVMTAHEAFNLVLNDALAAHDRVIREEESKASALQKVRSAMDSLEQLFDTARTFYGAEPTMDASAAVCFMIWNQAFQDTVDKTSLQDVLTHTAEGTPG